ncbi:MAG: cyclohydrolase [Acidimicrobiia bacterium]|nr:cyclohydrolase [Acidimicrobiia bacterium]
MVGLFSLGMSEIEPKIEESIDLGRIEKAVREIIEALGEDPEREGLVDTPERVAAFYAEVFDGLHRDPGDVVDAFFGEEHYQEIVMVREIPFYSMCEHHFVPFHGQAHVAYIPKGQVTGLSKLARLVEGFARRPQMQERLTAQVADALTERLQPLGVMVVVEAEHLCMSMRGVKKPGATTVTSAVRGIMESQPATRAEAMSLLFGTTR